MKAKKPKVSTAKEVRALRAWTKRAVEQAVLANERTAKLEAQVRALIDVQKLALRQIERLMREKQVLVNHVVKGEPLQFDSLPDDFGVVPFHRNARL